MQISGLLRLAALLLPIFVLTGYTAGQTCPQLSNIANGKKVKQPIPAQVGDKAKYKCLKGFILVGNKKRKCVFKKGIAKWNKKEPECVKECPGSDEAVIYNYSNQDEFDISIQSAFGEDALDGSGSSVSLSSDESIVIESGSKSEFRVLQLQMRVDDVANVPITGYVSFVDVAGSNVDITVNLLPDGGQIVLDSSNLPAGGLPDVQSIIISFDDDVEVSRISMKACCPQGNC